MLSNKAKYGLKALLYLADRHGLEAVHIQDIAEREHIPKKFLDLILLDLKKHGILR
ncbi:MAG: Rrf2 family transcriptional regulator, partial [Rhodospirillales bacterium]|nr:Rrf2 family transcriptional regulator [Rhodospirillales bacterium]